MKRSKNQKRRRGGQSVLEFTFVGIPLIFILISIFEISRGMWVYQTLAYAAKAGVRYAVVHGQNCTTSGSTCAVNFGPASTAPSLLWVINNAGAGLDITNSACPAPPAVSTTTCVTLTAGGTATTCGLVVPCGAGVSIGSLATGSTVRIDIQTPFKSAIAMFWTGSAANSWNSVNMYATASDTIKF